jgi:hypothetical protein
MPRLALPVVGAVSLVFAVREPAPPKWISPCHYRILLSVDPRGVKRSHSPASIDLDLSAELAAQGGTGRFDESSIEMVAYDSAGEPVVYDASRNSYERHLLPWRIEKYYPLSKVTLSFTMPDEKAARYAVYFDTVEAGRGHPERYPGLVGEGDWFIEGYGRREIAASRFDTYVDLDGDGDLDLVKGGTEPYLRVYENVGQGRFVDRGKLTSGGEVMVFPHDLGNRSWLGVEFFDWDGDGDQDMFVHFEAGPYRGTVVRYENTTRPGGPLTFVDRGPLLTVSGKAINGAITFVDWDGDGRTDVLSGSDGLIAFHRNIGSSRSVSDMKLADGVYLKANGAEIQVDRARIDVADIDGDGDLDLFVGVEDGRVYLFENVGTRTNPVLAEGRMIVYYGYMDAKAGVKVADFDGDGLLDLVVGRYWERTESGEEPRIHGRLYRNVGTRTAPHFQERDAFGGAPYTERLQRLDAGRQNSVRAVDWDNDGRTDLIVGDSDGFVWFFRNLTGALAPLFAPGVRLTAGGAPIRVHGDEEGLSPAGYARPFVVDWDNDGRKDLLVADGGGWLMLYLNHGTDASPALAPGQRVVANGKPIEGTRRCSVIVCDWDGDGRKDVILAMAGEGRSAHADWPHIKDDPSTDRGFLFYKNVGTDAHPVLAAPRWIRAGRGGRHVIDFDRPNLGAYVDWDGDGRKDFIACEFERNVRLFRNTGVNPVRGTPRFESSAEGVMLVEPWTAETVSGADAIDWNRDGDLDILTGEGHAGSGLRFWEHDCVKDFVGHTSPVVSVYRPIGPRGWLRRPWFHVADRGR